MSPSSVPAAGPVQGSAADTLARTLLDPAVCPSCGAPLPAPRCPRCGVDLAGAAGQRVWVLGHKAVMTLREREQLLTALRADAERAAAHADLAAAVRERAGRALDERGAPSAPSPGVPAGRLLPPVPPAPPGPPPVPARPGGGARGPAVQSLLVGLGALLLAVAAVVFLAVAWDLLGLAGRAAVVAVVTAGALAGAAFLRPRLPETAEALGGLGAVLLLGDAWAARATGLAGAEQVPAELYAAAVAALAAALLGWLGTAARLRSGTVAAALLAPAAPVLAALYAASHEAVVAPLVTGLLAGAAVAAGRAFLPTRMGAEARVARGHAALQLAAAVLLVTTTGVSAATFAGAAGCVVVLALQAHADSRGGARATAWPRLWCATAGAAAVLTAALAVLALPALAAATEFGVLSGLGLPSEGVGGPWAARAAVAVAAALTAAGVLTAAVLVPRTGLARRLAGRGLHRAPLAAGAGGALGIAVLPVAVGALEALLALAAAPVPAWRFQPGTRVDDLLAGVPAVTVGGHLALVAGIAVPAVLAVAVPLVLRSPRAFAPAIAAVRSAGAALLAAAAVLLGVLPGLPVATSAALLAAVAVAAGAAAGPSLRRLPLAVCVAAATAAVAVGWTAQLTSGPVTAVGVLGLLAARRVVPRVDLRAGLAAAAVVAGGAAVTAAVAPLLDARAAWAVLPPAVAAQLAAVLAGTCALAGVAALALPVRIARGWAARERRAAAGAAAAVGLLSLPGPLAAGLFTQATVVLAGLLALALAAALGEPRMGAGLRARSAGTAVMLAAAVAASGTAAAGADAAAAALAAVLVAVAAAGLLVTLAVLLPSWPADARRVPVEAGAAVAAAGGLLLGGVLELEPRAGAWLLLALTGAGLAAVALTPGRALLADVAVAPLAAASALLLDRAGVDVPEAYTLPPAVALLALGVLRLRAGAVRGSWSALGPGLVLGLMPSVVAAGQGPLLRIVVLTLAAAAVVLAGVRTRSAAPVVVGSLALAAHAAAQLGPWLVEVGTSVPRWTVLAVVGVLLLTVGATYERQVSRLRAAAVRLASLR